jgi:gluconolactonase
MLAPTPIAGLLEEPIMFSASFALVLLALAAGDLPDAKDVKPMPVVLVPEYSEGIVFDHQGNAYISHGEVITKISPDGRKSEIWTTTTTREVKGAPNGHKILADGTHLVCDGNHRAVLHLDAQGKMLQPASQECEGRPLRAPNDLTLDPKGGFYFTDPGDSDDRKLIGTVHYVDPKGKTLCVARGLAFPNGIVLRPDGKELLVGESKKNRILVYPVEAPGKLGAMKVFADLPAKDEKDGQIDNQPDGMCLDADGNLYVAHYGMRQVQVLSPDGKLIRRYRGGTLTTSNVAFGGKNMDQLYVTGGLGKEESSRGALFQLDLKGVKGLVILPARKE